MKTLFRMILTFSLLQISPSYADRLNLSDFPLFLGASVDPNVFFEVDDSGSMDWEILTKPYWHFCSYDPNAGGGYSSVTFCGSLIDNGLIRSYANGGYRYFSYMYQNSDNLYSDNCFSSDYNSVEACSSAGTADWRFFTPDLNFVFYNADTTYTPWQGPCYSNDRTCDDANFNSARSNPHYRSDGYSRTKNLNGSIYHIWIDDKGYQTTDGRPLRASAVNATDTPNGEVDLWDSHYQVQLDANSAQIRKITYTPTRFSIGESNTVVATLSNKNACYNILGTQTLAREIFDGELTITSTDSEGCRTLDEAKQNFANWYQYARKRSLVAKSSISHVINLYPGFRFGLSVINQYYNLFKEVPDSSTSNYTSHNLNLLDDLFRYQWQALGTPLRSGLDRVGQYYDGRLFGVTNPIIHSCQQNFAVLLTDGFWNGSSPFFIGNADGDRYSVTVADVAKYYYDKDLSSLSNNVIPNAFDSATHQHMVTYTVAFGVTGLLQDTDDDGWPNPPLTESSNWGNPFASDPEKIDDLWHAAYNSKGTFVQAQTPQALANELGNALSNISNRVASAAAAAQNSSVLNANSQVFQARFDSKTWTGEVLAFGISLDGSLAQTPSWNAGCILTGGACTTPSIAANKNPGIAATNRVIITRNWNDDNEGIAFRFPNDYTNFKNGRSLPDRFYNFLQHAPNDPNTRRNSQERENQTYGEKLLDYLRGDRSQEQGSGGSYNFRSRQSILGDIVHSAPSFVGPPSRSYTASFEASSYPAFIQQYSSRPSVVYVGGNDGMLHGFNATTGKELLAYIPGDRNLYKNLSDLSQSNYNHKFMVDGSPTEADVYINGNWKTILAGGLRNGGQTIYALDITDPSTFTEANADKIYLWEFSDEDDDDLGYVHGNVQIAKVRTGGNESTWAVIFGNGYNNSESDGESSNSGKAALFILFIEKGLNGKWKNNKDYIKIEVGSGSSSTPNGLAEPYLVDVDGDFITDYVYAGDLSGNIWKFDLRGTNPEKWEQNTSILFTATQSSSGDQPITAPPIVTAHPTGLSNGLMVYFGTGKYLEPSDNTSTNTVTQSFYGIWDKLDGSTVSRSTLLQQNIEDEIAVNIDTDGNQVNDTTTYYRQVTNRDINWATPQTRGDPSQNLGWFINLKTDTASSNFGERQVTKPILRNGNIIFTTLLPSASVCEFGGSSWLMELNAENGGHPNVTPFDVNNDGVFDQLDYINIGDPDGDGKANSVPTAGQKSSVGITSTPAVFLSDDKTKETKVLSGSSGLTTVSENPGTGPIGRQNWKQITQ